MKTRTTRRRIAAASLALALAIATACGDDDDDTTEADETTSAAETTPAADTTQAGETSDTGETSAGTEVTSGGSATTAATGEEPQSGGTFSYMHTIDVRSFDPTQSSASAPGGTGWQQFAVFDALVYEDAETGEIIPQTAESLESEDATVWTLKIKPGIEFSDGTPYDAEAVKFNWERIGDPANQSSDLTIVENIASMEVVDPLTLEITLQEPNGQFDRIVARRLALNVGSPTALQADPAGFADKPVGAGPFIVTEFIRQNKLTLERNPDYWNAPRPYIDKLEITVLPDDVQRFNALQSGQATMISDNSNPSVNLQAVDAGFDAPVIRDKIGAFMWMLNTSAPPFDNVLARQALAAATDKQAVIDTLFQGNGEPADFLVHEDSPFHDPDAALPEFDPAEAERLLEEYGQPLEFTILVSPSRLPYAEAWQAQLAAFPDIRPTIQQIDPSQVIPTLAQGQFQAVSFSMGGQDPEPDMYDHYHSAGARNYGKFSDPAMDAALEAGRTSLDEAERAEAYATMQQIVADQVIDLWYTRNAYGYPHQDNVRDLALSTTYALWDRVWLED